MNQVISWCKCYLQHELFDETWLYRLLNSQFTQGECELAVKTLLERNWAYYWVSVESNRKADGSYNSYAFIT